MAGRVARKVLLAKETLGPTPMLDWFVGAQKRHTKNGSRQRINRVPPSPRDQSQRATGIPPVAREETRWIDGCACRDNVGPRAACLGASLESADAFGEAGVQKEERERVDRVSRDSMRRRNAEGGEGERNNEGPGNDGACLLALG